MQLISSRLAELRLRLWSKRLWENQYSDKLLVALLRASNPSKYTPPRETNYLLDLDPDLLTTAQLDRLLDHPLVKMVGNDPEAIEAVRRDLAAGPEPMGTPNSRIREAAVAVKDVLARLTR